MVFKISQNKMKFMKNIIQCKNPNKKNMLIKIKIKTVNKRKVLIKTLKIIVTMKLNLNLNLKMKMKMILMIQKEYSTFNNKIIILIII